ncbi:MAG: V-type ATP synthase subunit I [Gammaproteobacteria bacterium]|nr:V-type ATP synthase subunit I [Gammaproteobacteria bacterium]
MAILPLRRINVVGPVELKREALAELQKLGCVHLIASVLPTTEDDQPAAPDEGQDAREALRYLRDCQARRSQVTDAASFDMRDVVTRGLDVKRKLRERQDRRDFLLMRISLLKQWGNFSLPPGEDIEGYRLWFYEVPLYQMDKVRQSDLIWQEVNRTNRFAYIIVISAEEPHATAMPVPRTHTGRVSLEKLRDELQQVELEIEDLNADREGLTRWIERLRDNLDAADDRAALTRAVAETWSEHDLFMIQGWAPAELVDTIRGFTDAAGLALLERAPAPTESPPTLLDNPEQLAGGQAIVSFWQLPGYRDADPSSVVAVSFALFFAMIMADAGYALVLTGLLAIFWRRLGEAHGARQIQYLGALIAGMSLLYGVLSGSYFGLAPEPGTLAARLKVFDIQDYPSMMRIAIIAGATHLVLGNLMAAWRSRGRHVAWGQLGWALSIAGGLLLWLGWERDPAGTLSRTGQVAMGLGLLAVLLFRGEQVVRTRKDLLMRLAQGGLALTSVTKAFGDVLSYLRLFALGLASASLAITFNQLAGQLSDATGPAGPYFATVLLLIGHTLNFALILVSAVVHGLRLNLIEFFNWSVMTEGYPFRAFHRRSRR